MVAASEVEGANTRKVAPPPPPPPKNDDEEVLNERLAPYSQEPERVEWSEKLGTWLVNAHVAESIKGLQLIKDFVSSEEEAALLMAIDANPWSEVIPSRRQQFYGKVYFHTRNDNSKLQPIPIHDDSVTTIITSATASLQLNPSSTSSSSKEKEIIQNTHFQEKDVLPVIRKKSEQSNSSTNIQNTTLPLPLPISTFTPLIERCLSHSLFLSPKDGKDDPFFHPDQVLVNEYRGRTGIRSHFEDEEAFGPVIVTVSLGDVIWITLKSPYHPCNSCPRIQRLCKILLPPRSMFLMSEESRFSWRHGISRARYIRIDGNPENLLRRNDGENGYRRVSLTIRKLLDSRKKVEEEGDGVEGGEREEEPGEGEGDDDGEGKRSGKGKAGKGWKKILDPLTGKEVDHFVGECDC